MSNKRPYSSLVVDGVEQAPSRAMLYPVGFSEADFKKPQIGIASTWSRVTPCNMHIDELAEMAAKGADQAGAPREQWLLAPKRLSCKASAWKP